ncbi:LPS export ABC transporter periplasmic protein LptC [Merismopedia glauca CCAP 1448/3]|uniref:LPS export ABC transporter periplasmic protein LptC n=2 Tax=Merismopedia TaxID=53402 RepID=A0A2T1BYJ1_9CYAN|nr:LPS export ABC transporter periplasmic protein LptC [Merismopedia glauca CCAP 1448/3]
MCCAQAKSTFFLILSAIAVGCSSPNPTPVPVTPTPTPEPKLEGNISLKKLVLEQTDEKGLPLWKIKAQTANYSQDRQKALVNIPEGTLFQDGKLVLEVSAKEGEIWEDGKQVFLKGDIVATDPRNGAVLRGQELEWRPKEDLLIVRNNVTGTHPQIQAKAKSGRYLTRTQKLELTGDIIATSKDPSLQLKTQHLIWQIPNQLVTADKPLEVQRYQQNQFSDRIVGNSGVVNLKTKTATLKQNVQLVSIDPPIQINGNSANWNLNTQKVTSDLPLKIWHRQEQVLVTANRGEVNLQQKTAVLTGKAVAIANRNQARLSTNQIEWNIATQLLKTNSQVIYQQSNPPLKLTGSSGVGKLQDQTFVVSGGNNQRVVTEIIP